MTSRDRLHGPASIAGFWRPRGFLYLVISSILSSAVAAHAESHLAEPPNVIVILTDDQGFGDRGRGGEGDCNAPGANAANCQHPLETALRGAGLGGFTPNIDQLALEGVRFSDFHVTPLCATTRASLLTGRFNHRTGVLDPVLDRQILRPEETTLADLFSEAGYRTGMFGKWNLGDHPPARPQDRGFDVVTASGSAAHGMASGFWANDCFGDTYVDETGHRVSYGPNHDPPQPGDRYCTDIFFDEAKAFISDHVSQTPGEPFFAYIATTAPHDIRVALPFPFVPPIDPDPSVVYESLGVDPVLADFYGAINGIDRNLGELRAFLQGLDLEDNTILVFLGDNGSQLTIGDPGDFGPQIIRAGFLKQQYGIPGTLTEPNSGYTDFINPAGLRAWKQTLYEGGHRVFLFIRWPDGGVVEDTVQQIDALTHVGDLFPTLLDLAGIEIAPGLRAELDGISLSSLLSGVADEAFDDRTIFVQFGGTGGGPSGANAPRDGDNFGVLTPEWRLAHPGSSPSELYAASDRSQSTDVAGSQVPIVADLEGRYEDYYDSWIGLYDDARDRGRIAVGAPGTATQTLTNTFWLATRETISGGIGSQVAVSTQELSTPIRGFWALDVITAGKYSIELRRWPSADLAPASIANQAIDPRGGGSARLVVSPEYFDVDDLALSGSGINFIDLSNPLDASDAGSEFLINLGEGEVFLGGELTGVRELDCDASGDPGACPSVLRSPYYATIHGPVVCGNGELETAEECDDGNIMDGDGCSSECVATWCGVSPALGCSDARKAALRIDERRAGKEGLKSVLRMFDPVPAPGGFGDPVVGDTAYELCIYDESHALRAALPVDRAADACGAKPCWRATVARLKYTDGEGESSGVRKLAIKRKGAGSLTLHAKNQAKKGQDALPTGIAAALAGHASATVQLVTSDAACFQATLGNVKKADGAQFKAKTP